MPYFLFDKCPEDNLEAIGVLCSRAWLEEQHDKLPGRQWEAGLHNRIYLVKYNPYDEYPLLVQSKADLDHTEPCIKKFLRLLVHLTGVEAIYRWSADNSVQIGRELLEISPGEIRQIYRVALSSISRYSGLLEEDLSLIEKVALRRIAVDVFDKDPDTSLGDAAQKAAQQFMCNYFDCETNWLLCPKMDGLTMEAYAGRLSKLREHFRIKSREYHKP